LRTAPELVIIKLESTAAKYGEAVPAVTTVAMIPATISKVVTKASTVELKDFE
jgi:hypothetical protein